MRTRLPIQTLQLVRACMVCMLVSAPNAFASTSDPLTEKYRISPEDVINISVWREEDMQREVVVRPDGGISFPLAGDIAAAGKTTVELEKILTARLHKYIPDAVVTVSMTQIQGLRIYVTGKVRSPGQFTVGRYIDVLQAITLAGGLTPFADQGDIRIMRRSDNGIHVLPFNYGQVEKGKNLKQNVILQTDDVVVVP
ncbi:MAG: polysaccharide biosynthesis/export family protein [Pseudomonadales bacterium]|nr:polysaccharide biosynthesis/export family protein [Pseudomonadales bacterium]